MELEIKDRNIQTLSWQEEFTLPAITTGTVVLGPTPIPTNYNINKIHAFSFVVRLRRGVAVFNITGDAYGQLQGAAVPGVSVDLATTNIASGRVHVNGNNPAIWFEWPLIMQQNGGLSMFVSAVLGNLVTAIGDIVEARMTLIYE